MAPFRTSSQTRRSLRKSYFPLRRRSITRGTSGSQARPDHAPRRNGFSIGTSSCAKSLSFRVATTSPWIRAVAAIIASSRRCSCFPSKRRAHSRKHTASMAKICVEFASRSSQIRSPELLYDLGPSFVQFLVAIRQRSQPKGISAHPAALLTKPAHRRAVWFSSIPKRCWCPANTSSLELHCFAPP